jgi:hypothetical protein
MTAQYPPNSSVIVGVTTSPSVVWTPSDPTGATDMTAELEAFRSNNLGKLVKVADGSTIKLLNAFGSVTTGDILLDFSNCTIVYDSGAATDYAIKCDNTANASAEVSVSSLALNTVNTDATVSQITLGSTLNAKRFDWVAIYSTNANPAKSGGYLGEIFQLLADEASSVLTATRKLNRHSSYSTTVKARKLDASRRVFIKGGIMKANGNPEDTAITTRSTAILIQGFVDPLVEGVVFDHPWSTCLRFQACAAPKGRNLEVRNIGNLAAYNGYTYGFYLYGMNDQADGRNLVVRNGRHAAFTTDGNGSNSSTWYNKGIPTNAVIQNVHGYNCHGSVVDTHEEGDNIVIDSVIDFYPYQDADISPNFSGLGTQIRASNVALRNFYVFGGTRGVKINAIDHGFEDQVYLENVHIGNTTQTATVDGDTAIQIDDQDALTNKRHVYLDGEFNNVGKALSVGKTAKLTVKSIAVRRSDTVLDAGAGSIVTFSGQAEFDFRNDPRTASYFGVLCRSDVTNSGATVLFLQQPKLLKGTSATPTYLFTESDTTASKKIYCQGIIEYQTTPVTATQITDPAATTFTTATVTDSTTLGSPRPLDQGFAGWAFDPVSAASNGTPVSGKVYMTKVVATSTTNVTKLFTFISAATAVSATANQNFLGLYDSSLNLLASTSAGGIDSQLTAIGLVTGTIASTPVRLGATYYVGFLWNGTATAFTLARGSGQAVVNANLAAASSRFAAANTGRTTLPNPTSSLVADTNASWAAIG